MTNQFEIYKCNVCGNTIEVLFNGYGTLVCCDQAMELMEEKTQELAFEKHVPVVECIDNKINVKIGSQPHPMVEEHYIQMIETISRDKKYLKRKFLFPKEEAIFKDDCFCDIIEAREICNIHGLWRTSKND